MTVKRATKTANITASLYDGDFQIGFDCAGVDACMFALCSVMPPDGSEECYYQQCGSCRSPQAQCKALETLRNKVTKQLKELDEEES